jgi:replicative DNA helicase
VKTLPHNLEAEQSTLGAILVRPEVFDQVAKIIRPSDFYRSAHAHIFQSMVELASRNEPVDLVTVTMRLKEVGQLANVGGPTFLAGLSQEVGYATNAEYYAF